MPPPHTLRPSPTAALGCTYPPYSCALAQPSRWRPYSCVLAPMKDLIACVSKRATTIVVAGDSHSMVLLAQLQLSNPVGATARGLQIRSIQDWDGTQHEYFKSLGDHTVVLAVCAAGLEPPHKHSLLHP